MEILIRKADVEDLDLLMEWRMEVLREVFPRGEYDYPEDLEEENREYYRRALPAQEHIACFASVDGETVGCGGLCIYQEMPSPDNPNGLCGYLMNIYCRTPYRRQGVAESVVRWLVEQAKDRHITKIYLETSKAARRLYEQLGFADMPDMMILPEQLSLDIP